MSRRNVYILAVLGLVVVAAAYYLLVLSPLRTSIKDTEASIATEQQTLAANKAKLAQMEQTRQEAAKNQATLMELSKMLPESTEVPSLLLQIQDLATESGIDFMTISPAPPQPSGSVEIVSLALSIQGSFFDINDFLYRAEQMVAGPGRLLAVKNISFSLTGDQYAASPDLTSAVTLYAFRRLPAAPTTSGQ
jgi:type IV pilus assembly protein PilO